MTPHRSHGRGTLVLKASFAGIRVERASGTNDPRTFEKLEAMFATLADRGRVDLIRRVSAGELKVLELWEHYRTGDLARLPTPDHARNFKAAFETWATTLKGVRHRKDMGVALKRLIEVGGEAMSVAEAPGVVERYRVICAERGIGRMFNKVRSAVLAHFRDTVKKRSPLWLEVSAIPTLTVVPKFKKNPQRPAAAWTIAMTLGGQAGVDWWTMCCTGMMPDEYFHEKYGREDEQLRIKGTKRSGRYRLVPFLLDPEPSFYKPSGFKSALDRSGLGVAPYDARRTFRHLMGLAAIPRVRREVYMGHLLRDMDLIYDEVGEKTQAYYLDLDAKRLDRVIKKAIGMTAREALTQLFGGITGGTAAEETCNSMTGAGLEPATYGLKVSKAKAPKPANRRKQAELSNFEISKSHPKTPR